jgi:WD40 repeat protein
LLKEDVTFLKVEAAENERAALPRASLGSSYKFEDIDYRSYGFPPALRGTGAHAMCEAIGRTSEGGFPALQLRSPEIVKGFSGAPVWNHTTQLVVGMVVSIFPPGQPPGFQMGETSFIRTIEAIRAVGEPTVPPDSEVGSGAHEEVVSLKLLPGSPYRGLEVFLEQDKEFYFGRDGYIEELISTLDRLKVVVITGISGAGKSSILRAGLAKGLSRWSYPSLQNRSTVVSVPTSNPILTLLGSLEGEFQLTAGSLKSLETSSSVSRPQELRPQEVAEAVHGSIGSSRLIVVVDQFERLFTDCHDENIRSRYIQLLVSLGDMGAKVLLGIRADFLQSLEQYPALRSNASTILLLQMNEEDLRQSIESPAEALGRYVEPEATRALISDVKDRPGDLPLLEFALSELWKEDNDKGVLTYGSYAGLGYDTPTQKITGAQGAIIKRAEEEWVALKNASGKALSILDFERIFLKLVQLSSGTATLVFPSSRRAWLAEFDEDSRKHAESLANSFLLTQGTESTAEPTVEVAHEALIRQWSRLSGLIEPNTGFITWYANEFALEFRSWLRSKKSHSTLLSGKKLTTAVQWTLRAPELLHGPASDYVNASRNRRRIKYSALAGAFALLLLVVAALLVVERQKEVSHALDLHEAGLVDIKDHDYDSAEVLLATSLQYDDDPGARQHFLTARVNGMKVERQLAVDGTAIASSDSGEWLILRQAPKGQEKRTHLSIFNTLQNSLVGTLLADEDTRIAISADGQHIAMTDANGALEILKMVGDSRPHFEIAYTWPSESGVDSIAFSPTGEYLAVGRLDGTVELRDGQTGSLHTATKDHRGAVHVVRFHPTEPIIVSGGGDRTVWQWDTQRRNSRKLGEHEDYVSSIAVSPNGRRIVSGGADGAVRVWQLDSQTQEQSDLKRQTQKQASSALIQTFTGHTGNVTSVAIENHGLVCSGGEDGTVRIWDTIVGSEVVQFDAQGQVDHVAFDVVQNGVTAVGEAAQEKTFIRTWNIGDREEGATLYNSGPVTTVALDASGHEVAAAGQDGLITVWDLGARKLIRQPLEVPPPHAIWSLAFTPDGHLISGGEDGVVRLWDLQKGTALSIDSRTSFQPSTTSASPCPQIRATDPANIWSIAINPSRPVAAVGVASDKLSCIYLVNLTSWTIINRIPHPYGSVWSLGFSRDGRLLAAGSGDKKVRLWDLSEIGVPVGPCKEFDPQSEIWGVRFTPDGKMLITSGLDRYVRRWNISDTRPAKEFDPKYYHLGLVQSMDLDPTGMFAVTASVDQTVKLWNLTSLEVVTLAGHDRPVWWVVFSPDGQKIVSGGLDRRVVIRDLSAIRRVLRDNPKKLLEEAQKETCLTVASPTHFYNQLLLRMIGQDDVVYTNCIVPARLPNVPKE